MLLLRRERELWSFKVSLYKPEEEPFTYCLSRLKIGVEMSFVLLWTLLFECNKRKYSLVKCAFTGFHTVLMEMSPVTLELSKKFILARK